MNKALFLSLTIAAVALAGCTAEPPAGSILATQSAADYSTASVTITATSADNSYPADDPSGTQSICDADDVGSQIPGFPFACTGATSTVAFTEGGALLPIAGEPTGYKMFLMHPNGDIVDLGALAHHGEGHYGYETTEFPDQDFSGAYQVQIRFGETIVATAPGIGGTFALAKELEEMSADVTYDGAMITVKLVNAPSAPFVAHLVNEDAETGVKSHDVTFLLDGNETTHTLSEMEMATGENVGDYDYFHVHVGSSSINVLSVRFPTIEE